MSNNAKIYLLSLMSFLVGTSQFIIVGVLDQIAASLGISIASTGQLMSVYALSSAIGTPLIMMATSKMDLRDQLLLSLIVFIIGVFAILIFSSYAFIVLSRVIVGVGAGVFVVTAYAISAKLAQPGQQGKAMANIATGFSIALVFGVPLGRMITALSTWQMNFWLIGILSIGCFFIVFKVLPKEAPNSQPPIALRAQLAYMKKPYILTALSVTLLFFISFGMINTYITPFLLSIQSLNEHEMSTILFALGIASFVGSKLAGALSDALGTSLTLFGSMGVHLVSMLLLFFTTHSIVLSAVLLFIWVGASWTFGPSQSINLVLIAPEASSMMLSLNSSFVQMGFAIGGALGGLTITHLPIVALCAVGTFCVSVAFYFLRLSRCHLKML